MCVSFEYVKTLFTLSGKCRGAFEKRCFLRYFLKTGVFFWKLVLVEDVVMNEFFRPFFSDVAWCSFFCCHFSVFLYKITINTSVNFVFLQPCAFKNQLSALVFLFLWRVVLLIYVVVYTNLFDVVSSFLNQIFFFKIIA